MPDLWERQRIGPDGAFVEEGGELEPVLWYGRFRDYLAMGPERTLTGCADAWRVQKGKTRTYQAPGGWHKVFYRWRWSERAQAWDAEQLRLRWAEDRERYQRMVRRHADIGRGMQSVSARGIQALARRAEEDPDSLTPSDVVRLAEAGIKAERQAEGLPTELIGIVSQLAQMSDDELREFVAGALADEGPGRGDATPAGRESAGLQD